MEVKDQIDLAVGEPFKRLIRRSFLSRDAFARLNATREGDLRKPSCTPVADLALAPVER